MGFIASYHLGRMGRADLGNLGSLSVISAEISTDLRLTFLKMIEIYLSGGAGYFYAFQNNDPSSSATNLVFCGAIGVGVRATPAMTVAIHGEYRRYQSLYQLISAGLGVDLWFGGRHK
jgi:hypothetical protein